MDNKAMYMHCISYENIRSNDCISLLYIAVYIQTGETPHISASSMVMQQ